MKFTGKLSPDIARRVEASDRLLNDPARLAALARTGLLDSPSDEAFDRLARLAATFLKVPLTIVSLVANDRQFFKAAVGLPAPVDILRQIPIDGSICRYTLEGREIVTEDAANDPLLGVHPATGPWGIGAFVAIPLITREGHVLGAFCAVDPEKRKWSDDELHLMRELTRSVMTEIELRVQVRDLESERELRARFVDALTHDLRTPLTAARISAQIIARKANDAAIATSAAARIVSNLDRVNRMIEDLLDASRIRAGEKLAIEPMVSDLAAIGRETVDTLNSIHGPRFEIDAPETLVGTWDGSAVRRIVENLAGNAVKYGAAEAPVKLTMANEPGGVFISVHNEGEAIAPENLESLFEPFRRLNTPANDAQPGWGIGLTLVRGFARAMGGSADVASGPGAEGTTFTVHLPRDGEPTRDAAR